MVTLVFTTVPPEVLGTETVIALYRLRWQVELAIKRLKSVLDLDQLRAKQGSPLADVWLHGKLLYALCIDKYARRHGGDDSSASRGSGCATGHPSPPCALALATSC